MRQYKSGLEFLNEGPYAERAREMKELCHQLGADVETSVVDGETLAYMLMEMYSRGLNDGASAALVQNEEIH
jgi:hypothetical protein